jgi:hypothetical protein
VNTLGPTASAGSTSRHCAYPRQVQQVHRLSLPVVFATKLVASIQFQFFCQIALIQVSNQTQQSSFSVYCSYVGVLPEFLFYESKLAERVIFEFNCVSRDQRMDRIVQYAIDILEERLDGSEFT